MLEFNKKGLLIPNAKITSTVDELKSYFVDDILSKSRDEIFNKYIEYSDSLKKIMGTPNLKQWINGSFVTKTPNPKDIDFVTFINYETLELVEEKLIVFNHEVKRDKLVDAYFIVVYPDGHPLLNYYISDKAYWVDRFDKTRRNRNGIKSGKGFLEIIY